MKPRAEIIKRTLFSVLWIGTAVALVGVGGFDSFPLLLAGIIPVLLLLLWLFPKNDIINKVVFYCFILISLSILLMVILWALFFGRLYITYVVLYSLTALLLCASCWLIKPA